MSNNQQRSINVDGFPLAVDSQQIHTVFELTDTEENLCLTPSDGDKSYVFEPLPRTDSQPTAKTSWSVFFFLFVFPLLDKTYFKL
jgi:hypothetical protein